MTERTTGMGEGASSAVIKRLRWFNAGMAVLDSAQGVAILALSTGFALPSQACREKARKPPAPLPLETTGCPSENLYALPA